MKATDVARVSKELIDFLDQKQGDAYFKIATLKTAADVYGNLIEAEGSKAAMLISLENIKEDIDGS